MKFLSKIFRKEKTQKEKYGIALDVGTEIIKALIFKVENQGLEIIGAGRQRQRLSDMQAGAVTDIEGVVTSASLALKRAKEQAKILPPEAIVGIAGELVKGQTTMVHYERLDPHSKIDLPELRNIIHKVQWKAFDQARAQLSWETGYPELDVKLVNAAIVDMRIDGYRVVNPLGFQGRDVQVSIFNSFAPLVHLGAIQTIISELDLDLISIATEPYAVARAITKDKAQDFSAIFIDIGGGTTDIAVVTEGGVIGTKMFALGGRAFTKKLSSFFKKPFDTAEKIKINYSQGNLNKNLGQKIKEALLSDCKVWLSGVELALSEFSEIDLLPSRILLCGGGSKLPEIAEVLKSKEWTKDLPFTRAPRIEFIYPDQIQGIIDKTKKLQGPEDITPLSLVNLALEMEEEEGMLPSILKKAIKLIQK